ncbi:unnamed protein product [Anisakis simplex]|uniref:Uncharacterized protein n=1 Tax=Anisakis simplex TaxID=6269 RepID=A0A0M3IZT9_ANISI|nr:unnamed protein product [Anisakis simplex]
MNWILVASIFCGQAVQVLCQVNLGSFSLGQNPTGDLEIGVGQMANIFGFGGDRGLKVTTGKGKFGLTSNQGALIGGERVGVDSGLSFQEGKGLDLGSLLNFGNPQPASTPQHPQGQFGSFLDNIGKFVQSIAKPSSTSAPFSPSGLPANHPLSPSSTDHFLPKSVGRTGSKESWNSIEQLPIRSDQRTMDEKIKLLGAEDTWEEPIPIKVEERRLSDSKADEVGVLNGGDSSRVPGESATRSMVVNPPQLPGLVEIDNNAEDKPKLGEMRRHFF